MKKKEKTSHKPRPQKKHASKAAAPDISQISPPELHALSDQFGPLQQGLQETQEKAQKDQVLMSALLKGARVILETREFKKSARSIFDYCKNLTGATAGYVALLSSDGSENEVVFLDSGGVSCTVDPALPMPIRGLRAEAYASGQAVYDNDFANSKWMEFLPKGHSALHNVLFAPLMIDEKVVGLLGLANTPQGFTDHDSRVVSALAQLASISLLNSRTIEALAGSQKRFASIIATAKEAIVTVDCQGIVTFWNNEAEKYFGYTAQEIIGKSCLLIMPEEYRQAHQKSFSSAVARGKIKLDGRAVEMTGRRKDGSTFPLELSLAHWEIGGQLYFTGMIRDISERKQAEEALKQNEQRFREVFMRMKGGGAVYKAVDNGRDFIFVDYRRPHEMLGKIAPENKIGKSLLEVFPEVKQYGLLDVFQRVWETGEPEYHPLAIYDGDKIAAWRENYVYKLPSGEIVALYDDLTERKRFEEVLKENEELFRTVFQTSPEAISISQMEDGRFININEGFTALTGYSKEDVEGRTSLELEIWCDPKKRRKLMAVLNKDGEVNNFEANLRLKDGSTITAMVSAKLIRLHNVPHLLSITRDITELKKKEQDKKKVRRELKRRVKERTAELAWANAELQQQIMERERIKNALVDSELKYRTVVASSLTGIYIISKKGIINFANGQFANIFGYSREEMIGMESIRLIHPEDRKYVLDIRKRRFAGEIVPEEYEIRGVKKNGETIWLVRRNTLVNIEGKLAILGNVVDITPRKKTEQALIESERELRVLSTQLLSAEEKERKRISHELHDSIGQALTAIKFSVENALGEMPPDLHAAKNISSLKTVIPLIQQTIEEVRRIIMDLRPSILDDLGIIATISWFCREFESIYSTISIEKHIAVEEQEIPNHLTTIIYRILQEGLNNAAKHSRTNYIRVGLVKTDHSIELTLEDKGTGFNIDKIFSMDSMVRGVGLASMRERTVLAGGEFTIKSSRGEGTLIRARWPLLLADQTLFDGKGSDFGGVVKI